jgi:hypothetical protein
MSTDNQRVDPNQDLIDKLARIKLQKEIDALEAPPKLENAELKKLQSSADIIAQQKAIVEGQKAIAEAQKATIEAALPKGTLGPLEGDMKVDDNFGYAAIPVAYTAIKETAKLMITAINAMKENKVPKGSKILIVNDLDFASGDLPLIQVDSGLKILNKKIEMQDAENKKVLSQEKEMELLTAVGVGTAVTGVLSIISDIIGYFQVNYEIKGQKFSIESQALQSIVASHLDQEFEVFINNFGVIENSPIINSFSELLSKKKKIDEQIEAMKRIVAKTDEEIKKKKDELDKLEKPPAKDAKKNETNPNMPKIEQIKDDIKKLNEKNEVPVNAIKNSEELGKSILAFSESVTKAVDEKTLPLLAKAALRQQLTNLGITHLLYLKMLSSGGEAMTLKSRMDSGKTAFIGGAVFSFILADKKGKILGSDVYTTLAQLNYNLSDEDERSYYPITFETKPKKGFHL